MKDVRRAASRPFAVERRALADAEAVLLVDDPDGEPPEVDIGFDQVVGADDQRELPGARAARASRGGARRASSR